MLLQYGAHGIALVDAGVHHFEAIRQGEGDVELVAVALVEVRLDLQQLLVVTDVEDLVDLLHRLPFQVIDQTIGEAGFVVELQQPGQLLLDHPVIALIDVEMDGWVTFECNQLGGDVGRQRLVEHQFALFVMHHGAVGGDEVDIQTERIAEAAYIDMVTAGGDHEFHALLNQMADGLPGTGGDLVLLVEQSSIEIGYNYLEHLYLGIN